MIAMLRQPWIKSHRNKGFTLIELLVVLIIIAILVAITIANYIKMKRHAEMASCIANQRNILEAAVTYSIETAVPDGDMNVSTLLAAGIVGRSLCDCPAEALKDADDYVITWLDGHPRDVKCEVKGPDHDWEPN
ncbi:MAG: prepilin-type N-terminal cleavage/methylation domain-containing protein [Candidatus Eisenbacteria bacterium]